MVVRQDRVPRVSLVTEPVWDGTTTARDMISDPDGNEHGSVEELVAEVRRFFGTQLADLLRGKMLDLFPTVADLGKTLQSEAEYTPFRPLWIQSGSGARFQIVRIQVLGVTTFVVSHSRLTHTKVGPHLVSSSELQLTANGRAAEIFATQIGSVPSHLSVRVIDKPTSGRG